MMKVFVLCFLIVFTSLANAGFFTPTPEKPNSKDDVIVKDDVVVGVEEDVGKTKVSVSPKDHTDDVDENAGYVTNAKEKLTQKVEEAKEKLRESTSSVRPGQKSTGDMSSKAIDAAMRAKREAERKLAEGEEGVKGFWRRGSPARSVRSLASLLHLLGFAVAYGMCVWVTFASSYIMAGALPRSQFAMLQTKIHPVYFKAMAGCVGLSLLGYLASRVGKGMMFGGGLDLAASLAMILVNLFYLEPRTTKVMNERMKKEKEEGYGKGGHVTEHEAAATKGKGEEATATATAAAATKPGIVRTREILMSRLNSNSSLLNVVTLMPLTWHLVQLAQNLQAVG